MPENTEGRAPNPAPSNSDDTLTVPPFRTAALRYRDLGWAGVLPLPPGQKTPPPSKYTGAGGDPTDSQVRTWLSSKADGNIALRLPAEVIGIDVDAYGKKAGDVTLKELEAECGSLPHTWATTSRDDGVSGIRLFRVPVGRSWVDQPDVEIIQRRHRYIVAPPSLHPDTGRAYRCVYTSDWEPCDLPAPDELPELPPEWVDRLGRRRGDGTVATSSYTDPDLTALVEHGIPADALQDAVLRDVAWKLRSRGDSRETAHTIWSSVVNKTKLTRPGDPWTSSDFDRHWRGADDKLRSPFEPLPDEPGLTPPTGGWGPLDLSAYLDGTYEPLEAKLLRRNDGVALLYPGMTHSLHGESESGKSMIAQYEAVQQMQAGNSVLYADYEADAGSVIERMLLMGATREQIAMLLTYVNPELDPDHNDATRAAFDALLCRRYALAVLDGVNEALTQSPARDRSTSGLGGNDDITAWQARLPRRIASRTGAAVVLIDHVAKGESAGRFAIGGQAKMAALTGAAYVVRPANPIGKGLIGTVELWVAKDRHGYVRGNANPDYKADRLQHVATAIVDGHNGLTIDLVAPPMRPTAVDRARRMQDRVVEFLRDLPADHEGASVNMVKANVSGKDAQVAEALKALVDQGEVEAHFRGPSKLHRLAAKQP